MVEESFVVLLPNRDDFDRARDWLSRFETSLRAEDARHLAIARNRGAEAIYSLDKLTSQAESLVREAEKESRVPGVKAVESDELLASAPWKAPPSRPGPRAPTRALPVAGGDRAAGRKLWCGAGNRLCRCEHAKLACSNSPWYERKNFQLFPCEARNAVGHREAEVPGHHSCQAA